MKSKRSAISIKVKIDGDSIEYRLLFLILTLPLQYWSQTSSLTFKNRKEWMTSKPMLRLAPSFPIRNVILNATIYCRVSKTSMRRATTFLSGLSVLARVSRVFENHFGTTQTQDKRLLKRILKELTKRFKNLRARQMS